MLVKCVANKLKIFYNAQHFCITNPLILLLYYQRRLLAHSFKKMIVITCVLICICILLNVRKCVYSQLKIFHNAITAYLKMLSDKYVSNISTIGLIQ